MKLYRPAAGSREPGKSISDFREVGRIINLHKRAAKGEKIVEFLFQRIHSPFIVHQYIETVFAGFAGSMAEDGNVSASDEYRAFENVVPQPGAVIRFDMTGGIQRRPLGDCFQHFAQGPAHGMDDDDAAAFLQDRFEQDGPVFYKIRIFIQPQHVLFRMEQ